jgi:ribonuclease T1
MAVATRRLLSAFAALLAALLAFAAPAATARGDARPLPEIRLQQLPPEAQDTLRLIVANGPFPFERDGITFGNREGLLPAASRGHYREYTVITPGLKHRGARRIVVGCERQPAVKAAPAPLRLPHCRGGGEFYYTADHYRSFRRIVE